METCKMACPQRKCHYLKLYSRIQIHNRILIITFDEYTCPHTLPRYHDCSMPHQVTNHEVKLYQV